MKKRNYVCLHASFFLLSSLRQVYPLAKIIDNDEMCQTSVFPKNNYQFRGN